MKLAIVGSRSFTDYGLMETAIAEHFNISEITQVVSGGAAGADRLGELWAQNHGIECQVFHAKWTEKGRAAGYARNVEIVQASDAAICFYDGISKGTMHTISICERYKVPCTVIKF